MSIHHEHFNFEIDKKRRVKTMDYDLESHLETLRLPAGTYECVVRLHIEADEVAE
jgi:hypothetical protein